MTQETELLESILEEVEHQVRIHDYLGCFFGSLELVTKILNGYGMNFGWFVFHFEREEKFFFCVNFADHKR